MSEPAPHRRSRLGLAAVMIGAGTMHFVAPEFFDDIMPSWVPGPERAWTYGSGVAELTAGVLTLRRSTAETGALLTFLVLLGVYPANIWDTIEHPPTDARGIASLVRLPLQIPLFVWALRVRRRAADR